MTLHIIKPKAHERQTTLTHEHDLDDQSHIPILSNKVVNVASVPQRSPLRYPGGKTWLIPQIRNWLVSLSPRPTTFIEPFAGGAVASLTAVMERFVDRAILGEKDPELANFWRCIFEDGEALARRVERFTPSPDNVRREFEREPTNVLDAAFQTLLKNRVNRGGIIAKGASRMNRGENGNGIASRWYAKTIAERIRAISSFASRFEFVEGDGIELIGSTQDNAEAAYFIDPPYTVAGKRAGTRLYNFNEIDHESLFDHTAMVQGPFMMTYDENLDVIEMATNRHFHLAKVAMKNTHHAIMYELLITSDELNP